MRILCLIFNKREIHSIVETENEKNDVKIIMNKPIFLLADNNSDSDDDDDDDNGAYSQWGKYDDRVICSMIQHAIYNAVTSWPAAGQIAKVKNRSRHGAIDIK